MIKVVSGKICPCLDKKPQHAARETVRYLKQATEPQSRTTLTGHQTSVTHYADTNVEVVFTNQIHHTDGDYLYTTSCIRIARLIYLSVFQCFTSCPQYLSFSN